MTWSVTSTVVPPGEWRAGTPVLRFDGQIEGRARTIRIPRHIGGRYDVEGLLAAGGMGAIFEARDNRVAGRQVLIKSTLYRPGMRDDCFPGVDQAHPQAEREVTLERSRLEDERELLVRFSDLTDRIPAVRDWVTDYSPELHALGADGPWLRPNTDWIESLLSEEPYLVLQRIPGLDLHRSLNEGALGSPGDLERLRAVVGIGRQLATILSVLHRPVPELGMDGASRYYVFQDLKPSNVMRTPAGLIFLIDFGSVRPIIVDPELGEVCGTDNEGTDAYRAPELRAAPEAPPTERTDLYTLGATLYHLLSGAVPPVVDNLAARARVLPEAGHPPLRELLATLLDSDPARRSNAKPGNAAKDVRQRFAELQRDL